MLTLLVPPTGIFLLRICVQCKWCLKVWIFLTVVTEPKVALYSYLKGASSEVGVILLPGNK